LAAISTYRREGDLIVFLHTETDPEFEGRGIAGRLAAAALDDVRARGLTVDPQCPFISAYIRRHRSYRDLVRPGRGDPGR
jgi:predicted GNAT family acetyltransferase